MNKYLEQTEMVQLLIDSVNVCMNQLPESKHKDLLKKSLIPFTTSFVPTSISLALIESYAAKIQVSLTNEALLCLAKTISSDINQNCVKDSIKYHLDAIDITTR